MTDFFYLIPIALLLGAAGLATFLWCLRTGQYDDLDGAAERILFDDDTPSKAPPMTLKADPGTPRDTKV
jgi:cbb3-type cytochrome oxidase maturation protein